MSEPEAFDFAGNLKRIRTARKLSHRALADAANVSASWISNIESGQLVNPGAYSVYRLALVLRVPMEELMGVSRLSGRTRITNQRRGYVRASENASKNADNIGDDNSTPGDSG